MKDEEFDALLRDAARTYNPPPGRADPDAAWRAIERRLDAGAAAPAPALALLQDEAPAPRAPVRRVAAWTRSPWLRMAAVLLVGVAIGRVSARSDDAGTVQGAAPRAGVEAPPTVRLVSAVDPRADDAVAGEYLDQMEALLAELPGELRARRADPGYQRRAGALLLRTRLLLDSPAAADPALRSLFDDLEIVLAQVVRLDAERDPMDIDFLHQAIEQRDVLPRLRDAVADHGAD